MTDQASSAELVAVTLETEAARLNVRPSVCKPLMIEAARLLRLTATRSTSAEASGRVEDVLRAAIVALDNIAAQGGLAIVASDGTTGGDVIDIVNHARAALSATRSSVSEDVAWIALADVLDEDGRPKSADCVRDEHDDDIALVSGQAIRAIIAALTAQEAAAPGGGSTSAGEVDLRSRIGTALDSLNGLLHSEKIDLILAALRPADGEAR